MAGNLKEIVGRKAAHLVKNDMIVGLGTGSTVAYTIQELGERIKKEGLKFKAIPTSTDTEKRAKEAGIELITFEKLRDTKIDLAIDGADEVDKELNLIKGGGGAHLREKRIAYKAKKFVVIVDESKLSDILGSFPIPVEVKKEKFESVTKELEKMGAKVHLRQKEGKNFVTDNGNYILDAKFNFVLKPEAVEDMINRIQGVEENGIFRKSKVSEVWVGRASGKVEVLK